MPETLVTLLTSMVNGPNQPNDHGRMGEKGVGRLTAVLFAREVSLRGTGKAAVAASPFWPFAGERCRTQEEENKRKTAVLFVFAGGVVWSDATLSFPPPNRHHKRMNDDDATTCLVVGRGERESDHGHLSHGLYAKRQS